MNTCYASTTADWRAWLARNCRSEKEVWLVIYHSGSGTPSPRYHEAIEHALCYGWIDSHAGKHDADSSILRFTPRKPRSTWSRVNRERAAKMTARGLMTEHGQALIDLAKATGTWQVVSDADSSSIPSDLKDLLDRNEAARQNFHNFPPSAKRLILEWIAKAKRPDTRQRRIERTVELAAVNVRARPLTSPYHSVVHYVLVAAWASAHCAVIETLVRQDVGAPVGPAVILAAFGAVKRGQLPIYLPQRGWIGGFTAEDLAHVPVGRRVGELPGGAEEVVDHDSVAVLSLEPERRPHIRHRAGRDGL